jgi:hypothetical protein
MPLISGSAFSLAPPVVAWATLISENRLEVSLPATPTIAATTPPRIEGAPRDLALVLNQRRPDGADRRRDSRKVTRSYRLAPSFLE